MCKIYYIDVNINICLLRELQQSSYVFRPPTLQDDDIRLLCVALERNASLTSIDLRMNDISADQEDLDKIEVRKMAATYNVHTSNCHCWQKQQPLTINFVRPATANGTYGKRRNKRMAD